MESCGFCQGGVASLLKNKKIADIGGQKDGTMQSAKSVLNCKNQEQNSGKTEHDWNVSWEQVGRNGEGDKNTAESKHHEKIKKITADYIAYKHFCLLLADCCEAWGKFRKRCAHRRQSQADNKFAYSKIAGYIYSTFDEKIWPKG